MALVGLGLTTATANAAEKDVLLEFHFQPVPNAQIAIWLETPDGKFVQDVFVTQATGTLGIGNRPGRSDFLSSWRFPYGPRPGVLPVWGHARGRNYPKLVFHDDSPSDQNSLGWHENASSPEPYFCRPLSATEHETISMDTMTCPSPAVFQSDKGRFTSETSVYPPRSDLVEFEDGHDHPDVMEFSQLNDLDAVSKATPAGNAPELATVMVRLDDAAASEPMVAWIEVNLEADENPDWEFDRDNDHYVDPRLSSFGIEYFGQPSVLYKVEFDALMSGFTSSDHYAGYGDLQGRNGDLNPPDASISNDGGSGADRLTLFTENDETFRFGVYSHGTEDGPEGPGSGWGSCEAQQLPALEGIELEPVEFDRVRVHFTVPEDADPENVRNIRLFYRAGDMPLSDDNASAAIQQVPDAADCGEEIAPGVTTWCEVDELFGATNYQIGVRYEDSCANASGLVADAITTPQQEFAVVDGLCFVATAAYGAAWEEEVASLRHFRDFYLKPSAVGTSMVAFYYTVGPSVARLIQDVPVARSAARIVLKPIADTAKLLTIAHYAKQ